MRGLFQDPKKPWTVKLWLWEAHANPRYVTVAGPYPYDAATIVHADEIKHLNAALIRLCFLSEALQVKPCKRRRTR
jgi:hypothetical protein